MYEPNELDAKIAKSHINNEKIEEEAKALENKLLENYDLKKANEKFSKFGFKFFKIKDHHSGSHFEDGSLIVINSSQKLDRCIKKVKNKNWINYLKFSDIVIEYFND